MSNKFFKLSDKHGNAWTDIFIVKAESGEKAIEFLRDAYAGTGEVSVIEEIDFDEPYHVGAKTCININ